MRHKILLLVTVLFSFISANANAAETYQLSMLPRYSSEEILARISPLAKYLSDEVKVEPYLTDNFNRYLGSLKNQTIEIGYQNPYIYVLASGAHEVIAMAKKGKDGDKFRGIIITRPDSDIVELSDLKGKSVAHVGSTSAGGFLSQKLTLQQAGIDVAKDLTLVESAENKQENVILAVFTGDVDAGFIRESALEMGLQFIPPGAIKTLAQTQWLPNWALSVKRSLPAETKEKIKSKLLTLEKDHPVLQALKIDGFRAAEDVEYNSIRVAAGLDPVQEDIQDSQQENN